MVPSLPKSLLNQRPAPDAHNAHYGSVRACRRQPDAPTLSHDGRRRTLHRPIQEGSQKMSNIDLSNANFFLLQTLGFRRGDLLQLPPLPLLHSRLRLSPPGGGPGASICVAVGTHVDLNWASIGFRISEVRPWQGYTVWCMENARF